MRLNFAPIAGWPGDRRLPRERGCWPLFGADLARRLRRPLMLVVPAAAAVFGAFMYLAQEQFVSTDDAFVRAAKVTINARVSGQAVEIAVRDNERVRQGQVLFRIDPEPYQIAVDQAEARLGSARRSGRAPGQFETGPGPAGHAHCRARRSRPPGRTPAR